MRQNAFVAPFQHIQAVVFDWAGTTVDFGCQAPVQAFVEGFAAHGVGVTPEEARAPMGMGKREHVATMLGMPRIAAEWSQMHGVAASESDIDAVYHHVESVMIEVIERFSMPIRGVVDAVSVMREQGLRIGSCTGYPRSVGERLAERARKLGYAPDTLVCATDVAQGRPCPDMCLKVLENLNVTDPRRAVKIGDTVNDVLEGVRAGMWVIGITLTGSLSGLDEEELAAVSPSRQREMHRELSATLSAAGAHFTATDVPSCMSVLRIIEVSLKEGMPFDMS